MASLLAQTFGDFQLLIADNASTDGTEEICRELAKKDSRVQYVRHAENIGAAKNFNFVFRSTTGGYFKWAAHDDIMHPTYLQRCLEQLDADPRVVLAHSYSNEIDSAGQFRQNFDDQIPLVADRPSQRLRGTFRIAYPCIVWGVMRRDAIMRTRLFGSYLGSDWNFIGEMVLLGRIALVPEYLFSVRHHAAAYSFGLQGTSKSNRLAWFNPRVRTPGMASALVSAARFTQSALTHPMPMMERAFCLRYIAERSFGRLLSAVSRRTRGRSYRIGSPTRATAAFHQAESPS